MLIETERLIIRTLKLMDETAFIAMAADGSLRDVGFIGDCSNWMRNWITEAMKLAEANNPTLDYLAYAITLKERDMAIGSIGCSYYSDLQKTGITYFIGTQYRNKGYAAEAVKAYTEYFFSHYAINSMIATIREENISSWSVIEKAGYNLAEIRMYKDINDANEKIYRFYEIQKSR